MKVLYGYTSTFCSLVELNLARAEVGLGFHFLSFCDVASFGLRVLCLTLREAAFALHLIASILLFILFAV